MNRLKSIFISAFLMAEVAFLVVEFIQIFNESNKLMAGVSAAIPILIISMFAKFFLFKKARTSVNFPAFSVIVFLLFIGFLILGLVDGNLPFDLLMYNVTGVLGWIFYLKWYSVFPNRNKEVLKVGKQLPDLEFENTHGEIISTNDFKGNKVIYLFYRGNWCPLCMAQIKEIADQYQELVRRGVKIALISPQPPRHTKGLAKKYDVPFIFLIDNNYTAAKRLNIFHEGGTPLGMEIFGYDSDTVMPTVVICDEKGKVIFADLTDNYRVRPEPAIFLKILDSEAEQKL